MANSSDPTTIIRWAGSKRRLLPRLRLFWNNGFSKYIEPFAGSAALFFVIQPKRAVLGDLNPELLNGLHWLGIRPGFLHESLTSLPQSRGMFLKLRRQQPESLSSFHRAVRFFYLNRFCFNGLYRTNDAGAFNVPYSPTGTGGFPSRERFGECGRLLRQADLRLGDFQETVVQSVRRGDFVYLDPPFAVANRRLFRQYGPSTFGINDLDRLAETLAIIDKRGATFVLSYAYSPEAKFRLSGWRSRRVYVQRNVAGFATNRRKSVELIISNCRKWPALL